jgi:sporulation protein YlmC with PRC-barrel domain
MTTTVRWSQLIGQRVLAQDSGQLVGSLRRVLLDTQTAAVTAAQLEGGGDGSSIIDWSAIAGIASDAVMVARADVARDPRDERERDLVAGRIELVGKLVMTEMGDSLGPLEDLELEVETGGVLRLHVPGEVVEIERILALGPDLLILPERERQPEDEGEPVSEPDTRTDEPP